jgi:hypothetical protein
VRNGIRGFFGEGGHGTNLKRTVDLNIARNG